jgi:hypothetical protein
MSEERSISATVLTGRIGEIVEDIRRNNVVFLVDMGPKPDDQLLPDAMVDGDGHVRFAFGLPNACCAIGLVDPEYGWPCEVRVEDARTAVDIAPGYRRHPMLMLDGECVAASVMIGEYRMIRAKSPKQI